MSHWNFRLVRRYLEPKPGETVSLSGEPDDYSWISIHEVHYDDLGNPNGYAENEAILFGESLEEIRWNHEKMGEALEKPVLDSRTDFRPSVIDIKSNNIDPTTEDSVPWTPGPHMYSPIVTSARLDTSRQNDQDSGFQQSEDSSESTRVLFPEEPEHQQFCRDIRFF
jgi:hypothetical protein